MTRFAILSVAMIAALLRAAAAIEPPPVGPPWERELAAAQKIALKQGTPIFIYFTKTHCPHCVPIEKGVLPSPGLQPAYGKVAWLFNNRSFDESPADRRAERIELRFGISSYPHLVLVDPEKLTVISHLGRTERALLEEFDKERVTIADAQGAAEKLRQAELRLAKLEQAGSVAAAKDALADEDLVVRCTALRILANAEPRAIAAQAGGLLQVPSDHFRYQVCEVLAELGDPSAAPALAAMAENPKESLNPNVLRIHAVDALAKCGVEESIPVVAKFAATGEFNNGLTHRAVDALAEIAARLPGTKAAVQKALVQAYPSPVRATVDADLQRCTALAKKVHEHLETLSNKKVPFPSTYNETARGRLMASW